MPLESLDWSNYVSETEEEWESDNSEGSKKKISLSKFSAIMKKISADLFEVKRKNKR